MKILVTDGQELAALGAVRSLGRAGHAVTAAFPGGLARPAVAWSRYCTATVASPDPWQTQSAYRDWLLAEAPRHDLVLPLSEASILAAAQVEDILPDRAVVLPPRAALPYVLSKRRATARALAIGLLCPPTAFCLKEALALPGPFVVRTDNRLEGERYLKGRTRHAADRGALRDLIAEALDLGDAWIAQQAVAGSGVGAFVLRHEGRARLAFAHRRLHEVPFSGGWSSMRESIHAPRLIEQADALLAAVGFEGAAMVEFRRAFADGRPLFVEINGRLWGSIALALHCGVDFPATLVDCRCGHPPTPLQASRAAAYPAGVRCRNVFPGEVEHVLSVLRADGPVNGVVPPARSAAVAAFFRHFMEPRIRHDYLWSGDPLPAVRQSMVALRTVGTALRNKWQRRVGQSIRVRRLLRLGRLRQPCLERVLFLCYGNICRSAFAEQYWSLRAPPGSGTARSAGFYPASGRPTPLVLRRLARSFDVDLQPHRSRPVSAEDIVAATAVFVMDGANAVALARRFPEALAKTWMLGAFAGEAEIKDPYGLPDPQALRSLRQIAVAVDALLAHSPQQARQLPSSQALQAEPE